MPFLPTNQQRQSTEGMYHGYNNYHTNIQYNPEEVYNAAAS